MDTITMPIHEFKRILNEVCESASTKALIKAGLARPVIYRTDAIKLHGATVLDKLEKLKLLTRRQHHMGSNYYYDVNELNEALIIENREIHPIKYA